MSKIHVAVLRGGPSNEYEVSLQTGATVLKNLPEEKYQPVDIFISKEGKWHRGGLEVLPIKALQGIDVAFNALHGEYGEDGKVQQELELLGVPYTGSSVLPSALAMNKAHAKEYFKKAGLKTAQSRLLRVGEDHHDELFKIFRSMPMPVVVKPVTCGSSVGVSIVGNFDELEIAVQKAFQYSSTILIEEYIRGREATCGVIDHFRQKRFYSLLPVEILPPPRNSFYDYDAKYVSADTGYVVAGQFSPEEKRAIQEAAIAAHQILGLRHYSRSDFIVSPKRGVYILETNSQPGLTSHSLIPKSVEAIGSTLPAFLDHIVTLALA